ncbi:hypothetical protein LCGC14_1480440 [marine sediment metagenome]|uniref:Uncharacterized protein n=1 Tax=marine sediment metagenome TaxID=412755 RepID=A0A0F9JAB4_9ZZZZ
MATDRGRNLSKLSGSPKSSSAGLSVTSYRPNPSSSISSNYSGALNQLAGQFSGQYASARAANEQRYAEAKNIYEQIIGLFQPGGQFGKGFEAQIGRAKTKSVAQGTQALVSSGLYGTTQTAGLAKKFEEEVGAPARLQMEDVRMSKYAGAMGAKAGMIERREDEYPDYSMIMNLMGQIAGG